MQENSVIYITDGGDNPRMTPIHHRDCIINTYNKLIFTSVMFAKGEVVYVH